MGTTEFVLVVALAIALLVMSALLLTRAREIVDWRIRRHGTEAIDRESNVRLMRTYGLVALLLGALALVRAIGML